MPCSTLTTEVPLSFDVSWLKPVGSWSAPYVRVPPSLTFWVAGGLLAVPPPLEPPHAAATDMASTTGRAFRMRCALTSAPPDVCGCPWAVTMGTRGVNQVVTPDREIVAIL